VRHLVRHLASLQDAAFVIMFSGGVGRCASSTTG